MKSMNIKSWFLGVLTIGILMMPIIGYAADESDIVNLEKQLIQKETELLEPEMKLDTLIVERAKLDGVGGWFSGGKKKELERQMAEQTTLINNLYGQMSTLQKQIQEMVFVVAYSFEKNGEFKKAIDYYLKVTNQDDKVKFRIASCYKSLKEFEQAIQWFLKLARTDQNLLEVVDCYKLDGRMKEAIYWLFTILEPIDGNPAELTALQLVEQYNYSNKPVDYPNFNQRLSDVYLAKAVYNFHKDFNQARADYQKAVTLIAGTGDPKSASMAILSRYQNEYKVALDILDQQQDAANRYYENMLRDAKSRYDDADRRYRQAQRDAEDEYARRLDYSRREMERAEHELRQLQQQASPSSDLIAQAQSRVRQTRDQYQYMNTHRYDFIDEYIRPAKRDLDQAMNNYNDIVNRRSQIIEGYLAPYKAKVQAAKEAFELMRSLHDAVYGLN